MLRGGEITQNCSILKYQKKSIGGVFKPSLNSLLIHGVYLPPIPGELSGALFHKSLNTAESCTGLITTTTSGPITTTTLRHQLLQWAHQHFGIALP